MIAIAEMPGEPGHLLGTARMGTDPKTSVVDPDGRAHDVPNLLIAENLVTTVRNEGYADVRAS